MHLIVSTASQHISIDGVSDFDLRRMMLKDVTFSAVEMLESHHLVDLSECLPEPDISVRQSD